MTSGPRHLPAERLRDIARTATLEALRSHRLPDEVRDDLVLGEFIEGDSRIFQLYVPGDRPEDARIITRITVDAVTGETGPVDVFLEDDG